MNPKPVLKSTKDKSARLYKGKSQLAKICSKSSTGHDDVCFQVNPVEKVGLSVNAGLVFTPLEMLLLLLSESIPQAGLWFRQ